MFIFALYCVLLRLLISPAPQVIEDLLFELLQSSSTELRAFEAILSEHFKRKGNRSHDIQSGLLLRHE